MRPSFVIVVAALALAPQGSALDASYEVPEGLPTPQQLYEGGFIVAMEFADDGALVWAELDGAVRMLPEGAARAEKLYEVPAVRGPEWGVTGLALAPDFTTTRTVFLAYTTGPEGADPGLDDAKGTMRVVRLDAAGETLIFSVEATRSHNSGRLLVHDDLLYFSNGEHTTVDGPKEQRMRAEDPGAREGKVLRMTFTGEPAPGNPHASDPAFDPYVYSMGHRNPFGLAWDEERDRLVLSDPGPDCCEEINAVEPGANYGWPSCRGLCAPARADVTEPLVYYPKVITPVGMAVAGGEYYVGGFNTKEIRRAYDTGAGWADEVVAVSSAGILDVEASPDGETLYIGTWNGVWTMPLPEPRAAPPVEEEEEEEEPVEEPPVEEPPVDDPPANDTAKETLPPSVGRSIPMPALLAAGAFAVAGLGARRGSRR